MGDVTQAVGLNKLFESGKDPGFVLFVIAIVIFAIRIGFFGLGFLGPGFEDYSTAVVNSFNSYFVNLLFATGFMIFASLLIFKGKGIIATLLFYLWFVGFKGIAFDFFPSFNFTFLGVDLQIVILIILTILLGSVLQSIPSRFGKDKESIGQSFIEHLKGSGIVVLFFFLHMGLITTITGLGSLTSLNEFTTSLILYMPWWAMLGIFTTEKESFFITLSKGASVLAIMLLVTSTLMPEDAFASNEGLDLKKAYDAEQQIREKAAKAGNNKFVDTISCIFSDPGNPDCVRKKQQEAEIEYLCEFQYNISPDNEEEFARCKERLRKEMEKQSVLVSGTNDPTINQPLTAKFEVNDYFPKIAYHKSNEISRTNYPIDLAIDNPRTDKFNVSITCNFTKKGNSKESVEGIISQPQWEIQSKKEKKSFICLPKNNQNINGSYTLTFYAHFKGLETKSRLQRAFIGIPKSLEEEQDVSEKIITAHFQNNKHLSSGPQDFARINFAFGSPMENPIIKSGETLILASNVENLGGGRITAVKLYNINLDGFNPSNPVCFVGNDYSLYQEASNFRKVIYLPSCAILSIPGDLQNPLKYELREYEATLVYDYLIKEDVEIEVKEIQVETPTTSNQNNKK
jgi:hypothetical protein